MEEFWNNLEKYLGSFFRPVLAIAILILSIFIARLVAFVVKKIVTYILNHNQVNKISKKSISIFSNVSEERKSNRIDTLADAFGSFAAFVVYILCFVWALSVLNVEIGKLLTGAGLIGVALGFGAQSLVKDFLSGFFIISEDWYGVGDYVQLPQVEGTVKEISLRFTTIVDYNGTLWSVPNGEISSAGNQSSGWARIVIDIPVLYSTKIEDAEAAINEALKKYHNDKSGIFIEEPTILGIQELTANSSTLRVIAKTKAGDQYEIARQLKNDIKIELEAKDIDMPKGFVA